MSSEKQRANRRERALERAYEGQSKFPIFLGTFRGAGTRHTRYYQTAKNRYRVYLYTHGDAIASSQHDTKRAAAAKAKAWA